MRILTIFLTILQFLLLAFSILTMTGVLSAVEILDAYERFSSGVIGRSSTANHDVTAITSIAQLEGYTYPGQLDATITFRDADDIETVFDLHYPSDYNMYFDGFGSLWLANWRPDIANNPQVTPVVGNSCLQTINGRNLAPSVRYNAGYKEYLVCRVLDEEGPDAPRSYDITQAKPAVIGLIWASPNRQPMDYPRERCIAEVRIWSTEIAQPGDRFMACLFVINEEPQHIETYTFELTEDRIVEVGGAGKSWSRREVNTRAATRLVQYRLMKEWLAYPQAVDAAVDRAYAHITANLDQVIPARASQLDGVQRKNGVINFTFSAKFDAEMFRIRESSRDGAARHLYQHIRRLVCRSDERAALLAFQENTVTYTYDLNRRDGRPITLYGAFPNLPCR